MFFSMYRFGITAEQSNSKKSFSELVCWLAPEASQFAELPIGNSKCLSENDYMFVQGLRLLNNQRVQIINTFLAQIIKNFVRINEKLELMNCKLSVRFCQDLIINAHKAEKLVQNIGSSN